MPKILIVEDDRDIALGLEEDLARHGHEVETVPDGEAAIPRAKGGGFDLIVLDLMLPRKDGFEVCRELRRSGFKTPIIILTAKTHEAEKILGLELGADDYVTKPFSRRELLARIKVVLRRGRTGPERGALYRFGGITVDLDRCEVSKGGKKIDLTPVEFKLLRVFIENPGRVLSIDDLLRDVWGPDAVLTDRVVYTHVNHLRNKLEENPREPRFFVGLRGLGYRFDG